MKLGQFTDSGQSEPLRVCGFTSESTEREVVLYTSTESHIQVALSGNNSDGRVLLRLEGISQELLIVRQCLILRKIHEIKYQNYYLDLSNDLVPIEYS